MLTPALPRPCATMLAIVGREERTVAEKRGSKSDGSETMGQRLARLRKERGITQQELAERLGVSQPIVSDYERAALRPHGDLIVKLTKILRISSDELLGLTPAPRSHGRVKSCSLLRRIQQLDQLPVRDQQAVPRTLDAFLSQAGAE